MNIALDYDGTYTLDPGFWDNFIKSAEMKGHRVYIVTMRYIREHTDLLEHLNQLCDIVYTGRRAKQPFVEKNGIHIDVWIDDNPAWVYTDSR